MTKIARSFAPLALLLAAVLLGSPAAAQFSDQATYVGTAGGTANAITLAVKNWSRNLPGVVVRFLPSARNTGATTILVNGVGSPVALRKPTGQGLIALTGGELVPTQVAAITFDGTQWQLLDAPDNALPPGGYLTPCQVSSPSPASGCTVGQFMPTGNVISATTLYYEPVASNTVPIFNGGRFVNRAVTESQMTLILSATANLADHIYDVCVYNNDGVPAIGTMPGWSTWAAGSGARGSAADITLLNGVWVNSNAATVTNNNVGVTVPANGCTIVASILIDGVNGQVTFHRTAGQSRRWASWNFYNRQALQLQVTDSTASWSYTGTTIRPSNNNSANAGTAFTGLPTVVSVTFVQTMAVNAQGGFTTWSGDSNVGIGWNSTSAFSGTNGIVGCSAAVAGPAVSGTCKGNAVAQYALVPTIGANVARTLESAGNLNAISTIVHDGTASGMLMLINYQG